MSLAHFHEPMRCGLTACEQTLTRSQRSPRTSTSCCRNRWIRTCQIRKQMFAIMFDLNITYANQHICAYVHHLSFVCPIAFFPLLATAIQSWDRETAGCFSPFTSCRTLMSCNFTFCMLLSPLLYFVDLRVTPFLWRPEAWHNFGRCAVFPNKTKSHSKSIQYLLEIIYYFGSDNKRQAIVSKDMSDLELQRI